MLTMSIPLLKKILKFKQKTHWQIFMSNVFVSIINLSISLFNSFHIASIAGVNSYFVTDVNEKWNI